MNCKSSQLDSMTLTNGTNVSFQYNSDGLRVSKTVGNNTVKYRWDGTTLLAEEHSNYTITFLYDGDTLIGFNYGGNNYYYGIDNLGVIHYVYNEAGTVVVTYTYDAWGNTISANGNSSLININPIRYKSYYYDSETGLFYLQSRYYDAVVGRFISADDVIYSVIGSGNLFTYCENNPVNCSDPYGYAKITIVLKKEFLRDVVTASASALGVIIGSAIFGFTGTGSVVAGAIGGALGWIIGGSLSRKFINKDLKFSVWIPFVKSKTYTIW